MTALPGLGFRRTTERAARHAIWRARSLGLDDDSGIAGTLTRNTTATPDDMFNVPRTVQREQPAWHYSPLRARHGLQLSTNARLGHPLSIKPQAMGVGIHFIEVGGKAVVGGGVWYLGNDAATGARIYLDATGTVYRLIYTDGTTTRTSTMATAPVTGDDVWLRIGLTAAGVSQVWQSINGAAETTPGAAAATVLPAAWSATAGVTTSRINSIGTANLGNNNYLDRVIMLGAPTLAQFQAVVA